MGQAPPELEFPSTEARLRYLRWLVACSERLAKRKPDAQVRREFLQTVWYEAKRSRLEPNLVLGLIEGLTKVFFPEASNTVIFVIMVIVLLVRPQGLFGRGA